MWWIRRRADPSLASAWHEAFEALRARGLRGGSRALWFALLAWLALRSLLLFLEVATQPLYPWDAWMQWATKARVWFELKAWVPFVSTDAWLAAKGALYTDVAPTYPSTVPLWQVWSSLALGRYDDVWMNLPWWFASVAFAIAIYGALRRIEFSPLAALVGTWIVVSLPLADVHVALAGYADLPMAAYFTLAALATLAWIRTRSLGDAILALLLAIACPFIKTPGIVWVCTLRTGGRRCAPSTAGGPGRRHWIRAGHCDVDGSRAILADDPQLPASSRLRSGMGRTGRVVLHAR